MTSRYSHIVILLAAMLAFVPVFAVDYILNSYVRLRETAAMQLRLDEITIETEDSVYSGLRVLRSVIDASPSLCTPTFINNAQDAFRASLTLRQILVENLDGVQYCDVFGDQVDYSVLSQTLSLPGRPETLTIVNLDGYELPMVKVSRIVGSKRVSAFVYLSARLGADVPIGFKDVTTFRITLTNGTPIVTYGNYDTFANRTNDLAFILVNSFASEIPIRAEVAVPFADVRARYADLDWTFTIFACLMSGGFLFVVLQYVRRETLPAMDIERAIVLGELRPYYQPVIDLQTGRLLGCEMLVRWVKRNGKIIPPSEFIDYAETSGMAIPMTVHLMQIARMELSELVSEMPELKISINLFEGHFRDGNIVEDVQAIFADSPIKFRQLVFEITERRPMANATQASSVIAGLHALGCKLALDDVGTGHSNLAYMQTLGVDVIKIDQVFVRMIHADTTRLPVLDGLIEMARDMDAEIVAEGVETEEQALYLRKHGVRQAQGFLFAPALKIETFRTLARALNFVTSDNESEAA